MVTPEAQAALDASSHAHEGPKQPFIDAFPADKGNQIVDLVRIISNCTNGWSIRCKEDAVFCFACRHSAGSSYRALNKTTFIEVGFRNI